MSTISLTGNISYGNESAVFSAMLRKNPGIILSQGKDAVGSKYHTGEKQGNQKILISLVLPLLASIVDLLERASLTKCLQTLSKKDAQ